VGNWYKPDKDTGFFPILEDCLYKKDGNLWLKFTKVSRARSGYFKLTVTSVPLSKVLHPSHVSSSKEFKVCHGWCPLPVPAETMTFLHYIKSLDEDNAWHIQDF